MSASAPTIRLNSAAKSNEAVTVENEEKHADEVRVFRKSVMASAGDAVRMASRAADIRALSMVWTQEGRRIASQQIANQKSASRPSRFRSAQIFLARLKKFKYQLHDTYVEDIEQPTGLQRQLAFTEDPFWYHYIRTMLICLIIWRAIEIPNLTANFFNCKTAIYVAMHIIYLIDFFVSSTMQYLIAHPIMLPNPVAKPKWLYLIDIIAIIPITSFVTVPPSWKLIRIFTRCNSSLLLVRLMYEYLHGTFLLETSMLARLLELVILTVCVSFSFSSIILAANDIRWTEIFEIDWLNIGGTLDRVSLNLLESDIFIIFTVYLMTIMIYIPSTCLLLFTYILQNSAKYEYITHVHLFQKLLGSHYGISRENADRVLMHLRQMWNTRADFMLLEAALAERVCYETTYQAMWQDRNLYALQHCPMLCNMEFHVLRYLAQMITPKNYVKGIYLYKFPIHKAAMFYIASGEVHVLSSENCESPILKLTSGTCVGSIVLLYPYRSTSYFRTGSNCVIYELKARNFSDFARQFPEEYRRCREYVKCKINEALFLTSMKKANDPAAVDKTIIWIKRELHRLMSATAHNPGDHQLQNIYLLEYFKENDLNDIIFTKMNLNSLCVKPRDSQYNDLVFIKSTFPWVFQPDSPLLKIMWKLGFVQSIISFAIINYQDIEGWVPILWIVHCFGCICLILENLLLCMTPLDHNMSRRYHVIIVERCKTVYFLLDIVSIFISIRSLLGHSTVFAFLRLWRIIPIVNYIETNSVSHLLLKQLLYIATVYIMLWIEFGGLIARYKKDTSQHWYRSLLSAIEHTIYLKEIQLSFHIFPPHVAQIIISAIVASSYHLFKRDAIEFNQAINACYRFMNSASVYKRNVSLNLRLRSFIDLHIHDIHYLRLRKHLGRFIQLPDYIEQLMKPENLLEHVKQSQFFARFPRELVEELVECSVVETFYENAVILARGVPCGDFYVLVEGQVCSVELDLVRTVDKGSDLNCLEVIFGVPSARHMVAFSHVVVVAIPYDKFRALVNKYPVTSATYRRTVENLQLEFRDELLNIMNDKPQVIIEVSRYDKVNPVYTYKCVMFTDSFEAYDYFTSFDKLGIFSVLRFLLMRLTFHPEGKVYLIWEHFRVLCLCLGMFVYIIPAYLLRNLNCYILFFDVVGFIDIYIRLHVCYYNSDGILVRHPLFTAKNYIRRSFIVDLVSVLPLQFYSEITMYRSCIQALRIIQLYRIIAYKNYTFPKHYLLTLVGILYLMVLGSLGLSTLIFELHCESSTIYKLTCEEVNETYVNYYLHLVYLTTSELTGVGYSNKYIKNRVESWIDWILSFTLFGSIFLHAYCLGLVFSAYLSSNLHRYKSSRELCNVVSFMRCFNAPNKLVDHVVDYFEVQWTWCQDGNIDDVLQHMNAPLKRDLMYHVYADPFIRYNHFTGDYRNLIDFYKTVLMDARNVVCPTFGKFITHSDIDSTVYFLYRGAVEITSDQKERITTLLAGSIFGNLTAPTDTRQLITATAKCNTHCLCLKTERLLEILEIYPKIKTHFYKAAIKNRHFIRSRAKTFLRYKALTKRQAFRKKLIGIGLACHLVIVCYIGNLLNLYGMATGEDNFIFRHTLYAIDFLHVVGVLIRYFKPTKNRFGYWCVTAQEIYGVNGSRLNIFMDIITSLPLDIIVEFIPKSLIASYLYSALRVNRPLRVYYVALVYWKVQKTFIISSKQFFRQVVLIIYQVIFFSFVMTTMTILIDLSGSTELREGTANERLSTFIFCYRETSRAFLLEKLQFYEGNEIQNVFVTVFFLLCYSMNLIVVCQSYRLVYEVYCRSDFNGTILFNSMLKHSKTYTGYMKTRIIENARFVFSRDHKHSLRALDNPAIPRYIVELILNACFGDYLARHPIFKHCHPNFLRQVGRMFKLVDLPMGHEVIHKFANRRCMFFIIRGCVVALQEDDDIIENYLHVLRPGDCFCFLLGLDQEKRAQFTYTCRTHTTILMLEYDKWANILNYFPATKHILKKMGKRYRQRSFLRLRLPKLFAVKKDQDRKSEGK